MLEKSLKIFRSYSCFFFVHSHLQRREWIIFRNVYAVIRNKKVNGKLCESFLRLNQRLCYINCASLEAERSKFLQNVSVKCIYYCQIVRRASFGPLFRINWRYIYTFSSRLSRAQTQHATATVLGLGPPPVSRSMSDASACPPTHRTAVTETLQASDDTDI